MISWLKSGITVVLSGAVAFAILYNISFEAAPSASTARIAVFGLALLALIRRRALARGRADSPRPILLALLLMAFSYALSQCFFNGFTDWTMASRLGHFLLFVVALPWLLSTLPCLGLDGLLLAITAATVVQSALIFTSWLDADFRAWTADILVKGGNIELDSAVRPSGFTNGTGSSLSVIQALGCGAILIAIERCRSITATIALLIALIVDLLAALLTGRTGMLLGMALVGWAIALNFARLVSGMTTLRAVRRFLVAIPILVAVLLAALVYIDVSDDLTQRGTLDWAFEFFLSGKKTESIEAFSEMPIPRLSLETFFGTGLVGGPGYNASGHDSGYIQTYYALGLAMAAVVYATILAYVASRAWRAETIAPHLLFLVVGMMTIEVKEPYIFYYSLPAFIVIVANVDRRGVAVGRTLSRRVGVDAADRSPQIAIATS